MTISAGGTTQFFSMVVSVMDYSNVLERFEQENPQLWKRLQDTFGSDNIAKAGFAYDETTSAHLVSGFLRDQDTIAEDAYTGDLFHFGRSFEARTDSTKGTFFLVRELGVEWTHYVPGEEHSTVGTLDSYMNAYGYRDKSRLLYVEHGDNPYLIELDIQRG